jgi:hypothetical protein
MKVSCQLLVGAKHLEDKLSVIAKNSSPNASPVQLFVVSCQLSVVSCQLLITNYQLPITNYQLPITNYPLPITSPTVNRVPLTKSHPDWGRLPVSCTSRNSNKPTPVWTIAPSPLVILTTSPGCPDMVDKLGIL